MAPRAIVVLCAAVLALGACQGGEGSTAIGSAPADPYAPAVAPTPDEGEPPVDPASVEANELGQIPVIMHHRVTDGGGGEYDRSPENFRTELEGLYEAGYRPMRVVDLVRGEIDVPAGTTPVVLTFDDSSREQFALTPDGEVDPDTAIGILMDVAATWEDADPVASLYINAGPFGMAESGPLLTWLHEHGFELGNHTLRHANLGQAGAADVRRELALGARVITDHVPEAEVVTLSLPLGIWPDPRELAYTGEHEGDQYAHEGVLLVGAGPAPSPFSSEFDPLAIPRIRSSSWDGGEANYGSEFWLQWFEDNPDQRYVSDGNPDTVSYPGDRAEELDEAFAAAANPY